VPYAEEIIGEYQGGFRRGRSTFDKIFTMRQILRKRIGNKICTYVLYIIYLQIFKPHMSLYGEGNME